jgi:L-ascorbate metabolism protein UlaG (beta-lactamase superfamily)
LTPAAADTPIHRTPPIGGLHALGDVAAEVASRLRHRPSLEPYADALFQPGPAPDSGVRVTFLGVSSLLFDDGTTAILTDGFFTRPRKRRVLFGTVAPNRAVVDRVLRRVGVTRLAAVVAMHSHYDHTLDSPVVADATGALLVGSASTANIGRGYGLREDRIRVVSDRESIRFGSFSLTWIITQHCPPVRFGGTVDAPFKPPARAHRYRVGECYSVLVEHDGGTALVQGSAGFKPGTLQGRHADIVYLGIGSLGRKSEQFRRDLWREVVESVGARRVFPIHWDDYWRPLDQPLLPLPWFLDNFDASMRFLLARGQQSGVHVALPVAWTRTDPFNGL